MTPLSQRPDRPYRMPGHTHGLWGALVAAVRDGDEDVVTARRRLVALQLRPTYATVNDFRRVG
jgi:hypothetical protein